MCTYPYRWTVDAWCLIIRVSQILSIILWKIKHKLSVPTTRKDKYFNKLISNQTVKMK